MDGCEKCMHAPNCMRYEIIRPARPCKDFRDKETGERKSCKRSLHNASKQNDGTICLNCPNMRCSWMKNLIPVEGWNAKRTVIRYRANGKIRTLPSYRVTFCPHYEEDVINNGKTTKNVK